MCNEERMKALEDCVHANTRALRGTNGDIGTVARVVNIEQAVEEIKTNHLPHMKIDFKEMLEESEKRIISKIETELLKKSKNFMDEWVKPFIVPIGIALIALWLGLN